MQLTSFLKCLVLLNQSMMAGINRTILFPQYRPQFLLHQKINYEDNNELS